MGHTWFPFSKCTEAAGAATASVEAAAASVTAVAAAHVMIALIARDLWIKRATRCRVIRRPRDYPYPY